MTWAALAREVSVAASTIRRFAEATDAEADGVLALVRWLGAAPEDFMPEGVVTGAPLPAVGAGIVRVDMALVEAAEPGGRSRGTRTRTTIQHLAAMAQASGRPVAIFTQLRDA